MDVKNILELILALKVLGQSAKSILKDGIGADDLPKALDLIKKYELFLAAIDDIKLVVDEAKDLDTVEAVAIVTALMDAVKSIKEA